MFAAYLTFFRSPGMAQLSGRGEPYDAEVASSFVDDDYGNTVEMAGPYKGTIHWLLRKTSTN